MLDTLLAYLRSARVQNTLRAAARVWLFTFLGLFLPGLLGWLHDLTEWAGASGQAPFPAVSSLAYLGVAAIASSSTSIVTIVWRAIENATGKGVLRDVPFSRELEQLQDDQNASDDSTAVVHSTTTAPTKEI